MMGTVRLLWYFKLEKVWHFELENNYVIVVFQVRNNASKS